MNKNPKHYFALHDYGGFGICQSDIDIDNTVTKWKEVTCKNCLKKNKDKECEKELEDDEIGDLRDTW